MQKGPQQLMEVLARSSIFNVYASAFCSATGVAIHLEESDRDRTEKGDHAAPFFQVFANGLIRGIAPVRDGSHLICYICTAEIPQKQNTPQAEMFAPFLILLGIFADHLGMLSSRLMVQDASCEPATIVKAKQYIRRNYKEHIEFREVAKHACVSPFYLCKLFKRFTGVNFSTYLTHVRVEAAKQLLDHKNLRIGEIALDVGFQSLSHFNRVFKRITGDSPREYRKHPPLDGAGISSFPANNDQINANKREEYGNVIHNG